MLSKLARSLMQDDFTSGLRAAKTNDDVVAIVRNAIGEGDASAAPVGSSRRGRRGGRVPPRRTSRSTVAPRASSR